MWLRSYFTLPFLCKHALTKAMKLYIWRRYCVKTILSTFSTFFAVTQNWHTSTVTRVKIKRFVCIVSICMKNSVNEWKKVTKIADDSWAVHDSYTWDDTEFVCVWAKELFSHSRANVSWSMTALVTSVTLLYHSFIFFTFPNVYSRQQNFTALISM